jgi:DNA repair exonuclease SbcCD ATPase subunit
MLILNKLIGELFKMKKEKINQEPTYAFYSRVLKEAFDTVEELMETEEAHYAKIKAKEDQANQKKADAAKVEEAFKALNAERRHYKEEIASLTKWYSEELVKLKKDFESHRDRIKAELAKAEDQYDAALKAFTDKYDHYHMTLKDGDFETTISRQSEAEAMLHHPMFKDAAEFLNTILGF